MSSSNPPATDRLGPASSRYPDTGVGTALPIQVNWNLVWILFGVWAVAIVANFGTHRSLRLELALLLWFSANVLLLALGKSFHDLFLFLLLPSVLFGFVDYVGLAGIRVDLFFLVPALNLVPYCVFGFHRKAFPDRNRIAKSFPLLPFLVLFCLALVACTLPGHVHNKTESFRMIGLIFVLPAFYYVYAVHALARLENVKQVAAVIVLFASYYAGLLGLLQTLWRSGFARVIRNLVIYPETFLLEMWEKSYKENKISSIFPDSASFGHVLNFAFPLALGLYLLAKTKTEKLLYFGSISLIAVGTLITGNRTDLLGLMFSLVLVSLSFGFRSSSLRKTLGLFFLIGAVAVIGMMTVRENNSFRRLFMPGEWDQYTGSGRIILIHEGIRMFKEHPLTGVGPDHYYHNQFYINPRTGRIEQQQRPHNLFVQILAETGVIGTVAFVFLMVAVFCLALTAWRNRLETEMDFLCFLFLLSCITLLAQGAIENSLFYFQTSCLFWLGVGIWRGRAAEKSLQP